MKEIELQLQQLLKQACIDVPADVAHSMLQYLQLLEKWNKAYNLTAITSLKEMLVLHLMDSLAVLPYLQGQQLADVGTGAGLPGIPLALARPDLQFTLIESNRKKCQFLLQAVLSLGLKNVTIVQERAQAYQPQVRFDAIISRAFASLSDMLQATAHLAKEDGVFLAMKGPHYEQELTQIPVEFTVTAVYPLQVAGLQAQRHLVCISK